jgi:hypothetical protein
MTIFAHTDYDSKNQRHEDEHDPGATGGWEQPVDRFMGKLIYSQMESLASSAWSSAEASSSLLR